MIEGVRGRKKELALESADLLYHLLVLWADRGLKPEPMLGRPGGARRHLRRRAEKKTRKDNDQLVDAQMSGARSSRADGL